MSFYMANRDRCISRRPLLICVYYESCFYRLLTEPPLDELILGDLSMLQLTEPPLDADADPVCDWRPPADIEAPLEALKPTFSVLPSMVMADPLELDPFTFWALIPDMLMPEPLDDASDICDALNCPALNAAPLEVVILADPLGRLYPSGIDNDDPDEASNPFISGAFTVTVTLLAHPLRFLVEPMVSVPPLFSVVINSIMS